LTRDLLQSLCDKKGLANEYMELGQFRFSTLRMLLSIVGLVSDYRLLFTGSL